MQSENVSRCAGCGTPLGELHTETCDRAICWRCHLPRRACHCPDLHARHPFTGDLERFLTDENENEYHAGLDIDHFDYLPRYKKGKLVALEANRVGSAAWHAILTSPQTRDLTDITFRFPHLAEQTGDDCVAALQDSPLLPRLRVLQLGNTGRDWDAVLDPGDVCDVGDTDALAKLIESMPSAIELYIAADLPEPNRLLAAIFPPQLKVLLLQSLKPFDLAVLARNTSLGRLECLTVSDESWDTPVRADLHDQVGVLVNSPSLDSVVDLRLDIPQLDDACCQALVSSRVLGHLRRLWLRGDGLTDAGAAVLATPPGIRALHELRFEGGQTTEKASQVLHDAGVRVHRGEERSEAVPGRQLFSLKTIGGRGGVRNSCAPRQGAMLVRARERKGSSLMTNKATNKTTRGKARATGTGSRQEDTRPEPRREASARPATKPTRRGKGTRNGQTPAAGPRHTGQAATLGSIMIVMLPVGDLHPSGWNPNTMSEEEFVAYKEEVRRLGKPPKPIVHGYCQVDKGPLAESHRRRIDQRAYEYRPGRHPCLPREPTGSRRTGGCMRR